MTKSETSARESALLAGIATGCYIDGRWSPAGAHPVFSVEDPATELTIAQVADAGPADALLALSAAAAAQDDWARSTPRARADILRRAYDQVLEQLEDFALLITLEMGKPLVESRGEVRYAAEFLRWFSEQAERVSGEYRISPDGASRLVTVKQPVGPCLLISPWNFPLAMIARKIAPALAAGCTCIVKPAEETPLSCLKFVQVLAECGVPDGVVNVIPTNRPSEVVEVLLADPRLRKVSFTGSTEVGRLLLKGAAENILCTSMELGGNAPFIVFEDADLDAAVEGALLAKMRNGGESCVAANRFLVQVDVAEAFGERLAARLDTIRVGRGTESTSQLGPMINRTQRDRLVDLVQDAVGEGASVVCGGEVTGDAGHFFQPTVLKDVPNSARMCSEEIFGPVAALYTFESEAQAVRMANDTEFGLVAYLFTSDVGRAVRVSEALESGMVGVNRGLVSNAAAPFGGSKQSGLGREGGFEGINEYLNIKYLAIDTPEI